MLVEQRDGRPSNWVLVLVIDLAPCGEGLVYADKLNDLDVVFFPFLDCFVEPRFTRVQAWVCVEFFFQVAQRLVCHGDASGSCIAFYVRARGFSLFSFTGLSNVAVFPALAPARSAATLTQRNRN